MSPSHVSPAKLVTRQRRRFRSYSIDITAYRLAGTEYPVALTAAKGKGTFREQRSPIRSVAAIYGRSAYSPSRPIALPHKLGRYRGKADIANMSITPQGFMGTR
ncbi:hypothetical protein BRAS3843_2350004 [Bradyrhizobium sp. STM 3843]|nr:hypothetical protein BRAS3843_2350004 [Bradyrhizobium sp. STM 3843]